MQVEIYLDDEILSALIKRAIPQNRPILWQIEVELRRALGLPFPDPPDHRAGRVAPPGQEPLKPLPLR